MRRSGMILAAVAVAAGGAIAVVAGGGGAGPARADVEVYRAYLPLLARDAPQPATPTQPPPTVPTAAPTALPTAQPGVVTAHSSTWFIDGIDWMHVVGLVTNNTGHDIAYVEVTAELYSSSGTLLATDYSFADLSTIPAYGDAPFDILIDSPPPGVTSVVIHVTDYYTGPYMSPPASGLELVATNSYTDVIGWRHIVGTVTNTSGYTYDYVEPVAAFFNSQGQVILTDFTFTKPSTLGPGQIGTFELLFDTDHLTGPVANVRYWVDADRQ